MHERRNSSSFISFCCQKEEAIKQNCPSNRTNKFQTTTACKTVKGPSLNHNKERKLQNYVLNVMHFNIEVPLEKLTP